MIRRLAFVVACGITCIAVPSVADTGAKFAAVEISTGAAPFKAYIAVPGDLELSSTDTLKQFAATRQPYVSYWTRPVVIQHPYSMFVTTGETGTLKLSDIRSMRKVKGEHDGQWFYNEVPQMSSHTAALLQTEPNYKCTPKYVEAGEYWLSYNKNIGEKEMAEICDIEYPNKVTDEQVKRMLKNPDVIRLQFSED